MERWQTQALRGLSQTSELPLPLPILSSSCSPWCWHCCLAMLRMWCPSWEDWWEHPLACLTSGLTATNTGILSKFPSFFSKTGCFVNSLNCQHKMRVCQKYWLDKSRRWHTCHKCFSYFALENLNLQILTLGSSELLQAISVWIFYLWIEYFEIIFFFLLLFKGKLEIILLTMFCTYGLI